MLLLWDCTTHMCRRVGHGQARTIKRYGAAVIVMAFDEHGQAATFEDKVGGWVERWLRTCTVFTVFCAWW